jgi:hypothetical protein
MVTRTLNIESGLVFESDTSVSKTIVRVCNIFAYQRRLEIQLHSAGLVIVSGPGLALGGTKFKDLK